jgi:hypothetical protein
MTNKPKLQRRKVINIPTRAVFMGVSSACLANLKQYRDRKASAARSYRGGFPSSVSEIIKELISGRVLNLYSGASDIGTIRVDLVCKEATHNMTVEEFIANDKSHWDWVILDPPYKIKKPEFLNNFADARPLSGNALIKDRLRLYLRAAADNVLWLDYCSPTVKGFNRNFIWLLIPGNCWESCRVLTWLSRTGAEMFIRPGGFVAPGPDPGPGPAGAPGREFLYEHERTLEVAAVM